MNNLIEHMKKVAKEDVRTFFAPFVGAYRALKIEANRSPVSLQQSHKSK